MGDPELAVAIAARFYAVNGRHPMTADDDAYVSEWFMPVEDFADAASLDVDEIRQLQLANRLPLPSYIRSDGTQMVARDLLELPHEAGGIDELPAWFARQWDSPVDAVREWSDYVNGLYVCLRSWRPAHMQRKDELVGLISTQLERPEPQKRAWLERLHQMIDELDALEPPFAPYDRLRFDGPVSRDRLITAPRRDYPLASSRNGEPGEAAADADHQPLVGFASRIVFSLVELEQAIRDSWSRDTADENDDWTPENPSRGQCDITTLVVHDFLGGEILAAGVFRGDERVESHMWNRLPSAIEVDLTRDQFRHGEVVGQPEVRPRPTAFEPTHPRYHRYEKYLVLSKRVRDRLGFPDKG